MPSHPSSPTVLGRGTWAETRRIGAILRNETVGGALLLGATVVALVWANSGWSASYVAARDTVIGPSALHLDLSVGAWAADGLLAIFFFVAGLELKREFVAGDLRDPRRAAVPVAAAVGGMIVPALLYLALSGPELRAGWAIPTATDIAFALAVLAVVASHLPAALRTFLLTLAVVDDLLAIMVIALFYTDDLQPVPLMLAALPFAGFTFAVQRRIRSWWLLLPLALAVWALVHASGVHATVAGVLLGFAVPVVRSARAGGPDAGPGLAEHFEHRFRPLSAGVAVPLFALWSAGVALSGEGGTGAAFSDPVFLAVVVALVIGKPIGIVLATYLTAKIGRTPLEQDMSWLDVIGVGILGGIGFTVSLLIAELAFGAGPTADHAKVAILVGSFGAALLAAVVLRVRNRSYRQIAAKEAADADADGVPDVYERE